MAPLVSAKRWRANVEAALRAPAICQTCGEEVADRENAHCVFDETGERAYWTCDPCFVAETAYMDTDFGDNEEV